MRVIAATIFCTGLIFNAGAQNWNVDSTALHFPDTDEKSRASRTVWVKNDGPAEFLKVRDVDLFKKYGDRPFRVSDTSFTVAPGDSFALSIYFNPEHNIDHHMALILKSDNGFGHRIIELNGQGIFSNSYYSTTRNKSQEQLKTALSQKIDQNYNSLGYTIARDNMYATIDNSGGQVECVYTGRTATFSTRSGANSNSFNCEHTFPQGFYNKNEPMRSDIHHLFPTDVSANSRRSNDPFGVVTNANWTQGGSKSGNGKFEPRDVHKGDAARAMMYFVLQYRDYNNHFKGQENILRTWHHTDTVSTKEIQRNKDIYNLQNNRNPFVDYPQLEARIEDFVSNSLAPVVFETYYSDDTIRVAQGAGNYQYRFVIYNDGNTAIGYDSFQLNGAGLTFVGGAPGQFSLNPGEHRTLDIQYDGTANYSNARLQFSEIQGSTTVPVDVPLRSGPVVSTDEWQSAEAEVKLYPNPARDRINLEYNAMRGQDRISLRLLTPDGRTIRSVENRAEALQSISVSELASGLYILQYRNLQNDECGTFKIAVRH